MSDQHKFQLEVVERLARIETKIEASAARCSSDRDDNEERFTLLETELRRVTIDHEVARRAGRTEGRKTGAKWGAVISAAVIAVAEAARAWVR